MAASDDTKDPSASVRRHLRLVTDLPAELSLGEVVASESVYLNNISEGGLSFNSMVALAPGTAIGIRIPIAHPILSTVGRVAWCKSARLHHVVGVEFTDADPRFRTTMVRVVRSINEYRARILQQEGRALTGQEAAIEWMAREGAEFLAQLQIGGG